MPSLIPPEVEALPPPININKSVPSQVLGNMAEISRALNPAVLGIKLANVAAKTLPVASNGPSVFGLFHSNTAIPKVPTIISTKLDHKMILEFSDHWSFIQ